MLYTFYFKDRSVDFDLSLDNKLMVDATAMARIFNKEPYDFLKTENTQNFIGFWESRSDLNRNDIVRTSTNGGPWMHRKLAAKFAAWLSPEFENWVYDRIEEILFGRYQELDESLQRSARRLSEKDLLKTRLTNSDDYKALEKLEKEEYQDIERRKKFNKNQMDMFRKSAN